MVAFFEEERRNDLLRERFKAGETIGTKNSNGSSS